MRYVLEFLPKDLTINEHLNNYTYKLNPKEEIKKVLSEAYDDISVLSGQNFTSTLEIPEALKEKVKSFYLLDGIEVTPTIEIMEWPPQDLIEKIEKREEKIKTHYVIFYAANRKGNKLAHTGALFMPAFIFHITSKEGHEKGCKLCDVLYKEK